MSAKVERRLSSWIDAYLEYTETLPAPKLFRKWTGIFFVAAAMERRVWVRTMGSDLYPGLYIALVGPPGIGKGLSIYPGEQILREVPELHVGPSDITAASLIDALHGAVRRIVHLGNPPFIEFNSLTIISRELGVMIPKWDTTLMNSLTDIYDGFTIDQKRRGKDLHIKIARPQINMLAACTPSYLNEVLPSGAWDQGFISRTVMIFSKDRILQDPFMDEEETQLADNLKKDLTHDLKTIAQLYGKMSFTKDAAEAIREWLKRGCPPEPSHQKLQFYNSRRMAHLLKLCMISSVSRSSDLVIEFDHFREAFAWLTEAEAAMPDIFKSMVSGGDASAMDEAWNYACAVYSQENRPIEEHRLVYFIRERVPAHAVTKIIEVMIKAKMIVPVFTKQGFEGYKPLSQS